MLTKKPQKTPIEFICIKCDFICSNKKDYERHILTAKHKRLTNANIKNPKKPQKIYTCLCGKEYKQAPSLSRHKKKCKIVLEDFEEEESEEECFIIEENIIEENIKDENNLQENNNTDYKELFMEAMKTMQKQAETISELQQENSKMVPLIGNTTNNTTNNQFNLQFFLNEKCKDALNLTDFINSIQVQLKDLEYTAEKGHIEGITNIFHNALSNMEETKRPMHCTDLKREVLYIKDNDEWHKDENKGEIKSAVDRVVNKNLVNSSKWLDKYPEHTVSGSKDFENYIQMTANSLGTGEETEKNKIVKNIMREVIIEKKEKVV
tara:strand:+ start:181 stop:1146 length:966 start_codon:yes stop_codon:yes gene_type:complete